MKIISTFYLLLICGIGFSQNSFYFSTPLPSEEMKAGTVQKNVFGVYSSSNITGKYIVSDEGIGLVSTVIASLSRETVRETSKYSIRDGYIFGVVKEDSLPCIEENDFYYFGMHHTERIIGEGSQNVLTKIDANRYVINFYEHGAYIPILLTFSNGKMQIYDFDYDPEENHFDFISGQKVISGSSLVILSPTPEEFDILCSRHFFVLRDSYTKE